MRLNLDQIGHYLDTIAFLSGHIHGVIRSITSVMPCMVILYL